MSAQYKIEQDVSCWSTPTQYRWSVRIEVDLRGDTSLIEGKGPADSEAQGIAFARRFTRWVISQYDLFGDDNVKRAKHRPVEDDEDDEE